MTRRIYDKLVRDRIPEIIHQSGGTCGTETFSDVSAFRRALLDKVVEEAREAATAPRAFGASVELMQSVSGERIMGWPSDRRE